jgi:SAM-dependent methyltransferase
MMNPAEFANIAAAERDFWWYRGMLRILFELLDPLLAGRHVGRALEAGCGTGYVSHLLQTKRRLPIVPLDLGAEGLRYSRAIGLHNPIQADIAALPFPDAVFDLVLSLDVIVHFPRGEERRPTRELVRVLRPGGLLFLRVAALDILRSRHSEFAFERQRFTRKRLLDLMQACGVRVLVRQLAAHAARAREVPCLGAVAAQASGERGSACPVMAGWHAVSRSGLGGRMAGRRQEFAAGPVADPDR